MASLAKQQYLQSLLSDTIFKDTAIQKSKSLRNNSGHIFPVNYYYDKQTGQHLGFFFLAGIETDGKIHLIGGKTDRGENSAYAAQRETEEEIKLKIQIDQRNLMNVNGSEVYVVDATGWSTQQINQLIKNETRFGSQYHETIKTVWVRIDKGLSIKDHPEYGGEKDGYFDEFVNLARRRFRYEVKNGRYFY